MKTVLREIISMVLIASVMILILVLVFYDYLVNDNTIPTESEYARTNDVKQALEDKKEYDSKAEEAVIGTLTKAAYSIDEADINEYIAEGLLTQGKTNPFAELKTETTDGETENGDGKGNDNTSSGTSQKNNGASQSTNSTNTNSDSTGTFFEKPGTK